MSRKKKRNKAYTGSDSTQLQPVVKRYTAVVRSPIGQWWYEHKKQVRIISMVSGCAAIIGYLIYELIRLIVR